MDFFNIQVLPPHLTHTHTSWRERERERERERQTDRQTDRQRQRIYIFSISNYILSSILSVM